MTLNELYTKYKTAPDVYEEEFLKAIRDLIFRKFLDKDFAQELLIYLWQEKLPELLSLYIHNNNFEAWLSTRCRWRLRDCIGSEKTRCKRHGEPLSKVFVDPKTEKRSILSLERAIDKRWQDHLKKAPAHAPHLRQYWDVADQYCDESVEDGDWEVPLLLEELFGGGLVPGKTLSEIAEDQEMSVKSLKRKITRWAQRRRKKKAA